MSNLDIEVDEGSTITVKLTGDLDLASAPKLEQVLDRYIQPESGKTLLVDLSGLNFLDSSGLRVILSVDSQVRKSGQTFQLTKGPDTVQRVFALTLMDKRLDFIDSPADAESGDKP